ncbi:phenylalanine--tRNA ligase subunit beta [Candidatus Woesebacteria bacterium]|nr:phenylalanine--tRNA ligase subunit beta [Candidatus Woesebacteria bacterium]
MKIPLIWLNDYVETSKSPKEIAADFTQLGLMLDKPLDETGVLDLEQRLNRSDLLSVIGCARDLAVFEHLPLKLPKGHTKPGKQAETKEQVKIDIQTPVVRRFQTRLFKGIKVGPSPSWLTERLKGYGMESINNIVDITNFVMLEYGQPMHAQDIAKLPGMDITIRKSNPGEKLVTLLGTEITLTTDSHVVTSGGVPTVILGVVGGKLTGVTDSTTDIILDAGNYDSRTIRKSSRQLKIMNETVTRDDKFLDPRLIDIALDRATALILEIAGGDYYTNGDYYPTPDVAQTLSLRLSRLHALSGMDIKLSEAKRILKALEFVVVEETVDTLTVEVPYFRTDMEVEDDLISDILRMMDYNNIPVIPLNTPVPQDITPPIYRFEDRLRDLMVGQGYHEHITNSLTSAESTNRKQVVLVNALTSDLNALRTNLLDGLNRVSKTYKKHKQSKTGLFEIGKVIAKSEKNYLEGRLMTVLSASQDGSARSLSTLLSSLGLANYQITAKLEISIDGLVIGNIKPTSYTIVTDRIMSLAKNYAGIISEFDHITSLDLSLLAPINIQYADIIDTLSLLKGEWKSISCKSMTKMSDTQNNYLLTITWDADSKSVESDKDAILETLKSKLKIDSKS